MLPDDGKRARPPTDPMFYWCAGIVFIGGPVFVALAAWLGWLTR